MIVYFTNKTTSLLQRAKIQKIIIIKCLSLYIN